MADRNKNSEIFREKSIKRISSPEDLDKYIKATKPSLWLILCSIIILLIGIIVWASVGKIESCSTVGCKVSGGELVAYISETDYENICEESYIEIKDTKIDIISVTGPMLASEETDSFLLSSSGIEQGEWYYVITCKTSLADGNYKGKAVFELVSPLIFIIN